MRNVNDPWLDIAKNLPAGQKIRVQCCAADRSAIVSHNERGYSRFCFRCKANDFVPHGIRRISDIVRHKNELEFLQQKKVMLPSDYTLDVPVDAMGWYLKYGISPELARKYEIGYTEKLDRVVLPVKRNGELLAVQMRALRDNQRPKYLNPEGPKVEAAVFMSDEPTGITVVVEDILSAIKVGRVAHATSILGTTMTDQRAWTIAQNNHTAIIWMDNDMAGKKGKARAVNQLSMQGVRVYEVRTEDDPKTYNLDEIKEHLRSMKKC